MPSKTAAQTDSPESIAEDKGQKLQKVLANLGLGSRRKMERWIEEGRVTVDGSVATLGDRIRAGQSLRLDGKPLEVDASEQARVLLYHKPVREVCSRDDPEGRKTVFERLPKLKEWPLDFGGAPRFQYLRCAAVYHRRGVGQCTDAPL
jgi:ribosome-associated protein YbcJ (S4-like RNA binding protein)